MTLVNLPTGGFSFFLVIPQLFIQPHSLPLASYQPDTRATQEMLAPNLADLEETAAALPETRKKSPAMRRWRRF